MCTPELFEQSHQKAAVAPEKISKNDLLYHGVHGLCRVEEVVSERAEDKEVVSYVVVPRRRNWSKVRFMISHEAIKESGFHLLISKKEAGQLLKYLTSGKTKEVPKRAFEQSSSLSQRNQIWGMAETIVKFKSDKFDIKNKQKKQAMERAVRGIIGELVFVFNSNTEEMAHRILQLIESASPKHPDVLLAITNVANGEIGW